MFQINVLQAKTELSKLLAMLENGEEEEIVIARNGNPVARLSLVGSPKPKKRIGAAKGKFSCPNDIESYTDAINMLLGGKA
ncbi:MAG TPA: prevent-host-death protein [Treponema sp.]|nr:prevent-host-death protein [Treponema sp.]